MTRKADYHKYIFRNGQLLGQFERMYRESSEVPWRQDRTVNSWFADVAIRVLELRSPYATGIDVGCGLGYFTSRFAHLCRKLVGVDVSSTAIRKAKQIFPHVEFRVFDISKSAGRLPSFELVVAKDVFWYVFPDLAQVVRNLRALTAPGGRLFLFQSFPNLDRPFIGKDVIPNPERLLECFQDSFVLEYSCCCQEYLGTQDGPMYMALFRKKKGKQDT